MIGAQLVISCPNLGLEFESDSYSIRCNRTELRDPLPCLTCEQKTIDIIFDVDEPTSVEEN